VALAVVMVVKAMYEERWGSLAQQQAIATEALAAILHACITDADGAMIDDEGFLRLFGLRENARSARVLWRQLIERCVGDHGGFPAWAEAPLQTILGQGTLARRILRAVGGRCSRERIREVYGRLCGCLAQGTLFAGT
jgi:glutamate---cysteine ligase / carboxylate-amine ligase